MLPIVVYNNMEGSSQSGNSSFDQSFDDSVIVNCVRSRRKVVSQANCPVCSCTIRPGELESHLALELERLQKLSSGGGKRKLSASAPVPGTSTAPADSEEVDVSGCVGGDVYQRVHSNRLRRLRSRRRSPAPAAEGECPVCNLTLPTSRLQRHALRCLKRTGACLDEDVPSTSEDEGSIDVENDEPGGFGAEYEWCGEWRVRAAALQRQQEPAPPPLRRDDHDGALVVDGDEDAELYGPPQYSPSRIAPDSEEPCEEAAAAPGADEVGPRASDDNKTERVAHKHNGLVEASAETRIQALKARIKELEDKQNGASESKCLICLGPHVSPAVSIQCWHVYCEVCWLQSLRAKKICPQCNAITTTQHLRRIYM